MAVRGIFGRKSLAALALGAGLALAGCGQQNAGPPGGGKGSDPRTAVPASEPKPDNSATQPVAAVEDPLHLPFAKATRPADDPPEEFNRPPDVTCTGKPVGKLYKEVVSRWDSIRFTSPAGKRLTYTAVLSTELGEVEIALRPDLAPNHCRSFLALCQAGYYDGLFFDRVYHDESMEVPESRLDTVEAGCPLGTGEPGYGSIGYWLLPEFQPPDKVTHDEGTVGALRGVEEEDTAGCRFYITLNKAPFLDGQFTVFGKVTRGLDVARRIFERPIIIDEADRTNSRRPEKPVRIDKVTVTSREVD